MWFVIYINKEKLIKCSVLVRVFVVNEKGTVLSYVKLMKKNCEVKIREIV